MNMPYTSAATQAASRGLARQRDLINAVTLRPSEIFEVYGMPESTVCELCKHPDPLRRIPSYKIPGRQGRKGSRYIIHAAFKQWLAQYHCGGTDS